MRKECMVIISFIGVLAGSTVLWAGETRPAVGKLPQLAPVFSDHMVLQRDRPVPVWGQATAGKEITVEFAGQHKVTTAGSDGKWMVKLDALKASAKPQVLTVAEAGVDEKVVIHDVVVGEVWVGSGGSNMQTPATALLAWANPKIAKYKRAPQIQIEKRVQADIAAAAEQQQIRLLVLGQPVLLRDRPDLKGWQVCSSNTMPHGSFIGYCFARELVRDQNVPVGFITAAVGSSRIETWVQGEANYRACIQPLIPFAVRGILWHQGEHDIWFGASPRDYYQKLELIVRSWRKAWGRDDLPFYCGQLSAARIYGGPASGSAMGVELLPAFQDAQRRISNLPHTGLVVTSDLTDDTASMTPIDKWEVARRFWLWAAHDCYGRKEVVPSGPLFKGLEVRDGKAVLTFDHCGGGLAGRDNRPLRYFQMCGPNGAYYPAKAVIEGDSVILSNPEVKQPVSVRYAWHALAPLSLCNKAGLPASLFSSEPNVPEKVGTLAGSLPGAGIVKSPIPDKTVVLTFDDACLSQFTFAAPLLKQYGFGATFFVGEFPVRPTEKRDDLYMTWAQMKQLNDMGFEIGNHSMTHPLSLAGLPRDEIIREIAAVEEACVKNGIPKPVSFAYPNYSSSQEVMDIVRERGCLWGRSGGQLYDPVKDHSLMVPCVILPNKPPEKTVEKLKEYIGQARDGKALLLLFHGVPDKPHPWVTFNPENFENCMKILKESGCTVLALRDLSKYIDSKRAMDFFQPVWRD